MKIFKKYALLLIIVTCALHTGVFGKQTGEELAHELYYNIWYEKFDEAIETIKKAQDDLKYPYLPFFPFVNTPSQDYKDHCDEDFPNPLFMALWKSDNLEDFIPGPKRDASYRKCLEVAEEIIKAARKRLKGKELYLFAAACNSSGESALFAIIRNYLWSTLDENCLLNITRSLIDAAGYAIKQNKLGYKVFYDFILAKNGGETVFWRALYIMSHVCTSAGDYYNKVAKLFIPAIKRAEKEDYLLANDASDLMSQIFSTTLNGQTPLMVAVTGSQPNRPTIDFINLAVGCLSLDEFTKLIDYKLDERSAFDMAEGNQELRQLLQNARNFYTLKHEMFDKKALIKSHKSNIKQIGGNIRELQQRCLELKDNLMGAVKEINTVIE